MALTVITIIAISFITLSLGDMVCIPTEKMTHLHFFIQDKLNPPNRTAIKVAPYHAGTEGSAFPFVFGDILMVDDFITEGRDPASRLIGRAQGLVGVASLSGTDLLFIVNLAFTEPGPHMGSSLSLLSRDPLMDKVREIPVVGGTGQFRMARGYALMSIEYTNVVTGMVIMEVDLYVLHYPFGAMAENVTTCQFSPAAPHLCHSF